MKNNNGYQDSFAKLIQVPTVTNSDDENFKAFHKVLREEFPLVHEKLERTNLSNNSLIYKWKGKSDSKPVIFMAHQDVVPADGDWKYPAYSGEIAEGKVWGRGTIDCKNTLFFTIQAVEELLAEGVVPAQDIYLSYSDDEETSGPGCASARDWLTANGVKPYIALDEGGVIIANVFPGMVKEIAMIGVLEKGYSDLKFIARSAGGHSSQPPRNTPIARLSKFVCKCERKPVFKRKMVPLVKEMFRNISKSMKGPLKFILKNITIFSPLVLRLLPKFNPIGGALFGTTMTFTMATGSEAPNVIPQEATLIANLRFSPYDDKKKCFEKLRKMAEKYDIEMEILTGRNATPCVDIEGEGYKYFVQTMNKMFPEVICIPYLIFGGTDCRTMQEITPYALRCTPVKVSTKQLGSIHSANENIDVESLEKGVEFFKTFVKDLK